MKKILAIAGLLALIAAGCNKAAQNQTNTAQDSNSNQATQQQQSQNTNSQPTTTQAQNNSQTQSSAQDNSNEVLHYSDESDAEPTLDPQVVGVDIDATGFLPADVTIKTGDFVQFTNRDTTAHQPVSDQPLFASGSLAAGKNFRFQFIKAGTYTYHDKLNPNLKGTITVQ